MARLPWQTLTFTPDGGIAELSDKRRAALGPGVWLQGVRVTWRLLGRASAAAEQRLWLTAVDEPDAVRLVAAWDLPAATPAPPIPVWLQEPVRVERAARLAVIAGGGADPAVWLPRAARATAVVSARVPARLTRSWSDNLLVQIPSTRQGYERAIGVDAKASADIAAAAWPMGPDARRAAVQVVVNPAAVAGLDRLGLDVLLAHETTHVATGSPGSPAPTWLIEGYADHVALDAYPAARAPAAKALLQQVRDDGPPSALPTDAAFQGSGDDLDLAYAQAWLACRFIDQRFGADRLTGLYAKSDQGTEPADAIRSELDVSVEELTRAWRADLRRLAADPPW